MGLAEKLMSELKLNLKGLTLVPGDGGRFEVFVGKDRIYSKLETGRFPEWAEIKKALQARAGKPAAAKSR
ncbi:MAG: Rdx family protein [Planctomycetales bacterium]|nr:Rdx family protein [Planctomycetales bacterium]